MKKTILLLSAMAIIACNPAEQPSNNGTPNEQQDQTPGGSGDNPGGTPGTGDNTGPGDNTPDFSPEPWYETNYWERSDRERAGLRGPVKSWTLSSSSRVYKYSEAGNLTEIRDVDDSRGEWLEKYYYDETGRLVKKIYGRSTAPGTDEFDQWATLETWTYEYNNPGKYVWVRPDDSPFSSFYAFRHITPESFSEHSVGVNGNALIMKDLSAIHIVRGTKVNSSLDVTDYYFRFNADGNMEYVNDHYMADPETGENLTEEPDWSITFGPIVYKNNYPYSGEIGADGRIFYKITSMEWRDNGMPLRIEGMDGITLFDSSEKRYICTTKWECPPGEPHDSFVVFDYWETYKYNEYGDLIEMQERFNGEEGSENGWTRPTTWEFEYDSHGNWISYKTKYMIAFDGPDSEVKDGSLSREIEYY